jgi:hypothetical protein
MKVLPEHLRKYPKLCVPLSDLEMVNGVPEALYMKKIHMDTAIGPTMVGPKMWSYIFEELEPRPDGFKLHRVSEQGMKHYLAMVACIRSGKKYGVLAKTCLKDEAVDEELEKARIFYILEALFALLVRKYYLPIIEFFSRYPLISECAVGINCAGPEWEACMQHLQELATDQMMTDWDFSKYDLKRSMDVMMASLRLMRDIGEAMGYSQDDLLIMDGIADELRNPIVNWNGTILDLFLWTSGNSLTVYGNSVENALHQRASFHFNGIRELGDAFYKLGTFRENERILTYGDDGGSGSKPSVRSLCNFSAKKRYFDYIGMKITDAHKSDNPADVVHQDTTDFLKRRSVFHPELGVRVGALEWSSIMKMGHMSASNVDPEELALSAMNNMLAESFLHGKEPYETLRAQLILVAEDSHYWSDQLTVDYDTRVTDWITKYLPPPPAGSV